MQEKDEKLLRGRSVLDEMIKGYGPKFPPLETLFSLIPSDRYVRRLSSPVPGLGRYADSTEFMSDITSGKNVGLLRFWVAKKYFFALCALFDGYDGKYADQKIARRLTPKQIEMVNNIGTNSMEIFQAEQIEKFTEHDTAAAVDFVKLSMAEMALSDPKEYGVLLEFLEAMHFACTSEDNIGNVFGLILNQLVLGNFMDVLLDFCLEMILYVREHEKRGALILPALTHLQTAEPNTLSKAFVVRLKNIEQFICRMKKDKKGLRPFSGKMGGAIGNLACHYAAYPDIDWYAFAEKFVEKDLGLSYEAQTDQCPTYVIEAQHFTDICNILTEVIMLMENFLDWASCPGQLFVKIKGAGNKGSSIMPGKSNLWAIEGGIVMLKKVINSLQFVAKELRSYPHAGNMARSFLLRDIGSDFMPAFIALPRILKELKKCVPNKRKITVFLDEYPGMAGSSLQTVLKRMRIEGDAYREIQKISINPDGSYANAKEFREGLALAMEKLNLSLEQREELIKLSDFHYLVKPSHEKARGDMRSLAKKFRAYKAMAAKYKKSVL